MSPSLTLSQLAAVYLLDLEAERSASHLERCRGILERLQRELAGDAGDLEVAALRPEHLMAWRAERRRGGTSRSTANKEVGTLVAALRWAIRMRLLESNPLEGLRPLRVREGDRVRVPRALAEPELRALLEAAETLDRSRCGDPLGSVSIPQAPTWRLFASTGARRGELLALRWSAVDLDGGLVVLRAETTKGGRRRELPIGGRILEDLRALRQAQGRRLGVVPGPSAHVLLSPRGAPWEANPGNLRRVLADTLRAAGIAPVDADGRRFTAHGFRHTFASILAARGVSPKVAQRLLGHADVTLTLRIYTHLLDADALREGSAHVASALDGAGREPGGSHAAAG